MDTREVGRRGGLAHARKRLAGDLPTNVQLLILEQVKAKLPPMTDAESVKRRLEMICDRAAAGLMAGSAAGEGGGERARFRPRHHRPQRRVERSCGRHRAVVRVPRGRARRGHGARAFPRCATLHWECLRGRGRRFGVTGAVKHGRRHHSARPLVTVDGSKRNKGPE